jgi:hypothetical protein
MTGEDNRKSKRDKLVDKLLASQAGAVAVAQDDIPPGMNVFATMEAAWKSLAEMSFADRLTPKQMQDAKFIFFHGVQAAANLMIYCAGQSNGEDGTLFEAAADQIIKDCVEYQKEAMQVLHQRKLEPVINGADRG